MSVTAKMEGSNFNNRKQRFDETLKVLLIIATTTMTFSFNLYKELLGSKFFIEFYSSFVFAILLWSFSNIVGGDYEYLLKLFSWHFLTYNIVASYVRIALLYIGRSFLLWVSPILLVIIILPTWLIKCWLEDVEVIPSREYNIMSRHFLLIICIWTGFQLNNVLLS